MKSFFRLGCLFCLFSAFNLIAKEKIVVFAAASLTDALQDIAAQYQTQHDVDIVFSFASSSILAKQIQYGAPADIFISANTVWMDVLRQHQLIEPTTHRILLTNQLVLITAKNSPYATLHLTFSPSEKRDWLTWLKHQRLAMGDPDYVPAGMYAKEALTQLNDYGTVEPYLARTNNVRSALVLVARREAALGIVYASDLLASPSVVRIGTFPSDSHATIEYPIAILKNRQTSAINTFYQYLQQADAQTQFKNKGFQVAYDIH